MKIIQTFSNYRLDYLKSLSDWQYFGKGWQNRVEEVRGEAVSIAYALPKKLSGLGGAISGLGHLFGGIDWRAQLFLSIAIVGLAINGIKRRVELFEAIEEFNAEIMR